MCEHSMTSRRCDKTVSCHGGVLDVTNCRGSPSLVTLVPVCGIPTDHGGWDPRMHT